MLILSQLHKVSPAAQFVSQIQILRTTSNLTDLNYCMQFRFIHLFATDVSCAPVVEESNLPSLGYIIIDEVQFFVIFMCKVHGVTVP